ncbi:MAG: hypothetical protein KKF89_03765 [Nanoarchaeota archaeon]|nr:hypothetical protein [Nanoarchaeota archaeon]
MIGKPEWFTYRILGWGLRPKTKEGWLYILVAVLIALGISVLPISETMKTITLFIFVGLILVDVLHIMTLIGKHHDEREKIHQLIIERNCSFAAIVTIVVIVIYQSIKNIGQEIPFDISLMVVLGAMLLAKIGSTIYTKLKM